MCVRRNTGDTLKGGKRTKDFRANLRPYFRPHVGGFVVVGEKAVAASHPGIGPGAEIIGNYLQPDSVHHALTISFSLIVSFNALFIPTHIMSLPAGLSKNRCMYTHFPIHPFILSSYYASFLYIVYAYPLIPLFAYTIIHLYYYSLIPQSIYVIMTIL